MLKATPAEVVTDALAALQVARFSPPGQHIHLQDGFPE